MFLTEKERAMETITETITVNGIEYVRRQAAGTRAVVVVDRGWIFAGDVTRENGLS